MFFHRTFLFEATKELIKNGQLSSAVINSVDSLLACGAFRALGSVAAEYYLSFKFTRESVSKNSAVNLAITLLLAGF